jgi:hypothetical protein
MIERLDSPFATAHDLADLGIGHPFHKFEDQKLLAIARQTADGCQKLVTLFTLGGVLEWSILSLFCYQSQSIKGDDLPAAPVAVPVRHQVVRDAVQPGRKRRSPLHVAGDVVHSLVKDLGRQILCIMMVPGPIVDIVIDFVNVPFVQETEGLWIGFGQFDQSRLVT